MELPLLVDRTPADASRHGLGRAGSAVCNQLRWLLDVTTSEAYLSTAYLRKNRHFSLPLICMVYAFADGDQVALADLLAAAATLIVTLRLSHKNIGVDVMLGMIAASRAMYYHWYGLHSAQGAGDYLLGFAMFYVGGTHFLVVLALSLLLIPTTGFGSASILVPLFCMIVLRFETMLAHIQTQSWQRDFLLEEGFSAHFDLGIGDYQILSGNLKAQALGMCRGSCLAHMLDVADMERVSQMIFDAQGGFLHPCLVTFTLQSDDSRVPFQVDARLLPYAIERREGTISLCVQLVSEQRVPWRQLEAADASSSSQLDSASASELLAGHRPRLTPRSEASKVTAIVVDNEIRHRTDVTFDDLASYHSHCNFAMQWSTNLTQSDMRRMEESQRFIDAQPRGRRESAMKAQMVKLQQERYDRIIALMQIFGRIREGTLKKDIRRKRSRMDMQLEVNVEAAIEQRGMMEDVRHANLVLAHAAFTEQNNDIRARLFRGFQIIKQFLGLPPMAGPQHQRIIFPDIRDYVLHSL
eukprot:TRINITY_DN4932_c0_g1_i9.p1 TRINITY_DN4932_c0_g1~~TRINITY_DN4932_c0_g1_i9.p1  ORF type:complete len:525 (-),score=89.10 TRINITY_DN4932_c0_g1_i9:87-1661(-)